MEVLNTLCFNRLFISSCSQRRQCQNSLKVRRSERSSCKLLSISLKSRGQPVLWDQWRGNHGSDRLILCVQPADCCSHQKVARPWPVLLTQHCGVQPVDCISLSCRGLSSAMVKTLLGPRGIAVTHNSQPASEPTAGKTLVYSRSSLRVWGGFKFWVRKHSVLVSVSSVTSNDDHWRCWCWIWPLYASCLAHTAMAAQRGECCLTRRAASRPGICHNLQKLTLCRFKS